MNNENSSGEPELPACLGAIAGFDQELGLRNMLGNPARYLRMLGLFAGHHDQDAVNLRRFLEEGKREDARGIAHTLKGTAGTIGAMEISRIAAEIDAALRSGKSDGEVDALAQDLSRRIDELVACLRTA